MRRIERRRSELHRQLTSAATAIAGEAAWPSGTVTAAGVLAQANALEATLQSINAAEVALGVLRAQAAIQEAEAYESMRRVDLITTSLYGPSGAQKIGYGLRPIDTVRNTHPVPQVRGLALLDGPRGQGPSSILAKWKRIPEAAYDIQWFADEAMTQPLGGLGATRAQILIPNLTPGTQIWVRVRGHRGKRMGDWSDPATRIANV